jgi:hypothetical protein
MVKLERRKQRQRIALRRRACPIGERHLNVLSHRERQERLRNLEGTVDAEMDEAVRGEARYGATVEMDVAAVRSVKTGDGCRRRCSTW